MEFRRDAFLSLAPGGFHRVSYLDWGSPESAHIVICVHGLARNCRDFDFLARALAGRSRVVCMDVAGRGDSEWLADKSDYRFSTYLADAAALIARVTAPPWPRHFGLLRGRRAPEPREVRIDWVGTSMGGLIGMLLAARRGSPIRRLVLNDVGPFIPWSALARLKGYVGAATFRTLGQAELFLREACEPFGPLTDAEWKHLVEHGVEPAPRGGFRLRYDPAIGAPLRGHADPEFPIGANLFAGVDLWTAWAATRCPTLVLRGERSDVLSPQTLGQMRALRPDIEARELAGVGHAPTLMRYDQIAAVRDFLTRPGSAQVDVNVNVK
jgi:pimeloyl-ACP methyl ester carboxylesterase